jgi:hypothetical protein
MMADTLALHAAPQEKPGATAPPVSAAELWHMLAPWLGYVFLGAAGVLGLFTASGAPDDATYDVGLSTFIVAVVIIAVHMKRQLDGREVGFLLPVAAASGDVLVVTIAILGVLALAGAALAATLGGTLYGIGLAFFIVCWALIFIEIKRYFDRLERGP